MASFALLLLTTFVFVAKPVRGTNRSMRVDGTCEVTAHFAASMRGENRLEAGSLSDASGKQTPPSGDGLRAVYYNGTRFEEKVLSRIEGQVNYQWAHQQWAPGLDELNFSARWTGKLFAPVDGTYKLIMKVDDGVRFWLGGQLLVDEWHGQSVITYTKAVKLKAGHFYDLKIEYFNFYGPGAMQLSWELPAAETGSFFGLNTERKQEVISRKYLFSSLPVPKPKPAVVQKSTPPVKSVITPKEQAVAKTAAVKTDTKTVPARPDKDKVAPPDALAVGNKQEETEAIFDNPEPGKAIILSGVQFEQSQYTLLPESYVQLARLVNTLRQHPTLRILIAGHTDNVGDARLNQALSENRAIVVANYLIRNGIAEDRIQTRGYGSSQPIASNQTETDRAKNRRVEFTIQNQ